MRPLATVLALLALSCGAAAPSANDPLAGAVRSGDVAATRDLLAQRADPNAPAGGNGWTPLMHAVHKHQLATAAALIDGGANVNLAAPDGETPLMMAAGYGYSDFVKLLLARGADPRKRDAKGDTALDYAIVGANDIDRFTLFACQADTAALLAQAGPARSTSVRWAKIKRCG